MADGTKKNVRETRDLVEQWDAATISLGLAEKGYLKLHKTVINFPGVKQALQLKNITKGLKTVWKATKKKGDETDKSNKGDEKQTTILIGLVGLMTQYGGAAKMAAKGTSTMGKAFFSLASSVMFITGIFLVLGIALAIFVAIFADASSPLAQWANDIPILGEMITGFKVILVGEDGGSGLAGAIGVLTIALVAGAVAWAIFGAPAAIIVITAVLVVGAFRWIMAKTDSLVLALSVAAGILMLGASALLGYLGYMGMATFTTIMLPIVLITVAIGLAWAVMTGKVSAWWTIIVGALLIAAAWLLNGVVLFGVTLAFIPMVIIAVVVVVVILGVRYRKQIKAFFVGVYNWFADLFSAIGTYIGKKWDAMWVGLGNAWTSLGNFFGGIQDWFLGIPAWLGAFGSSIAGAVMGVFAGVHKKWIDFKTSLYASAMNVWNTILSLPGKLTTGMLNLIRIPFQAVTDYWADHVEGIIPKMDIPDWFPPPLGGMSFGPAPGPLNMFADGGMVSKPTLGMVGEAGPEAIIPLRGGNVPVKLSGEQYSDKTINTLIHGLSRVLKESGNTFNFNIDVSGMIASNDKEKEKFAKELSVIIEAQMRQKMVGVMSNVPGSGSWF
jgi:hypothetical protein